MNQSIEQSCLKFREIKFFVEEESNGLGVVYVSTGEGEFLANVDMNTGIKWDFSKKNVNKPLFRLNSMVFLHSQYLSEYEAGREIDTNSFDAKINQVKQKILRLYTNRLTGKASKGLSIDPTYIDDLKGKYSEILDDMVERNGASCKYFSIPDNDFIRGRLIYIGGVYVARLNLYRVVGIMGNYYSYSPYDEVEDL